MRGLEFTVNGMDTSKWNPLHYAVFYQQKRILEIVFCSMGIDLIWAMGNDDELFGYKLAIQSKNLPIVELLYNKSNCLGLP